MLYYLEIIIVAAIIIAVAKFVLGMNMKKLRVLIWNAIFGCLLIWLLNVTGIISIPLNIVTAIIVGLLGIPGVIVLIILQLCGIVL